MGAQQDRPSLGGLGRAAAAERRRQRQYDRRASHRLSGPSVPAWTVVAPGDESAIAVTTPPATTAAAIPPQIHQRACPCWAGAVARPGAAISAASALVGAGAASASGGGAVGSLAWTSAPVPTSFAAAPSPPDARSAMR